MDTTDMGECMSRIGRNDLCICGSGKKYKKCCLANAISTGVIDTEWEALRSLEGRVVNGTLEPYFYKTYPEGTITQAADEFFGDSKLPMEIRLTFVENMFSAWMLFDWDMDAHKTEWVRKTKDVTVAAKYLTKHRNNLGKDIVAFIETMSQTYYSFYVITEVIPNKGFRLKDMLLGTEHFVKEFLATKSLHRGDIIFSRILTLKNQSISVGMGLIPVPPGKYDIILKLKDVMKKVFHKITSELLRKENASLRDVYLSLINPRATKPILQNTDGEMIVPSNVYFKLYVDPEVAIEKLRPLMLSGDDSIVQSKKFKEDIIEIQWSKAGNKLHKSWDNTTLGNITIKGQELIASVNSKERAAEIKKLISKYLGDGVSYVATSIESVDQMMEEAQKGKKGKTLKPPVPVDLDPETQETVAQMMISHWDNWIHEPLPALNGLTPLKASKTKKGREMLESLLLYMDRENVDTDPLLRVDMEFLRRKLEM
jgi:hypothetical protein